VVVAIYFVGAALTFRFTLGWAMDHFPEDSVFSCALDALFCTIFWPLTAVVGLGALIYRRFPWVLVPRGAARRRAIRRTDELEEDLDS
jgi:hypothetical protein